MRPGVCDKRINSLGKKEREAAFHSVTGVLCESYGHLYGLDEDGQNDGVVVLAAATEHMADMWEMRSRLISKSLAFS